MNSLRQYDRPITSVPTRHTSMAGCLLLRLVFSFAAGYAIGFLLNGVF